MKKKRKNHLQEFLKIFKEMFYVEYQRVPNLLEMRFVKNEIKVNNLL